MAILLKISLGQTVGLPQTVYLDGKFLAKSSKAWAKFTTANGEIL